MALWGIILNGFVLACLIVCCVHIFCAIRKNWQEEVVTAETTVTPGRYQHTAGTLEDGDEKPRDMVRLKVLQLMFPGQAYVSCSGYHLCHFHCVILLLQIPNWHCRLTMMYSLHVFFHFRMRVDGQLMALMTLRLPHKEA